MGVDAQTHHPQQVLQLLQGLQHRNAELPARRRAQALAHLLRRGHRQLPNHRSKEVPDYRVSRLYLGVKTGKFYPSDLRAQVPVLEWLMWQMGGFGPMPG